MNIVFTGGHHNSALEVARHIMELRPDIKVIWLGHKHSSIYDKSISAEYKEVTNAGIEFKDLKAGKVYKTFQPMHWLRLPLGFIQSFYYLIKYKPELIVSFGGYLAVPVVLMGWLLRIPAVTHEQTYVAGVANRVVSKFAKKIFTTWPASNKYFDPQKTVLTGLPIRKSIFKNDPKLFVFKNNLPVIYIVGGKQGSHLINLAVKEALPDLLKIANVIHQTGSTSTLKDFEMLSKTKEELPKNLKENYILREYVFEDEIGSAFNGADLVVSRSGAHTIYELSALGKPAILIPIPWTSHNEQAENAKMLAEKGIAVVLPQSELNGKNLMEKINLILNKKSEFLAAADKFKQGIDLNVTDKIAREIFKFIK